MIYYIRCIRHLKNNCGCLKLTTAFH